MCRGDATPRRRLPVAERDRARRRQGRARGSARTRCRRSSGARSSARAAAARPTSPRTFTLKLERPGAGRDQRVPAPAARRGRPVRELRRHAGGRGARAARRAARRPAASTRSPRVREAWEAQWTPSTDVALVETIVLGDTLVQVASARARRAARAGDRATGEAADVLLEAVVAARAADRARRRSRRASGSPRATTTCPRSRAPRARSRGSSATAPSRARSALRRRGDRARSAEKTFDARRAARRATRATGDDEAVAPARRGAPRRCTRSRSRSRWSTRGAWFAAARELVDSYAVNHGACAGLARGPALPGAGARRRRRSPRSSASASRTRSSPARGAAFLEGFLEVNALVLVKSRAVVGALDAFLAGHRRRRASATCCRCCAARSRRSARPSAATCSRTCSRVRTHRRAGARGRAAVLAEQGQGEAQGDERRHRQGDGRPGRPAMSTTDDASADADRDALLRWRLALGPGAEKAAPEFGARAALAGGAGGDRPRRRAARRPRRGARRSSTTRADAAARRRLAAVHPEVARPRCASSSATTWSRSCRRTRSREGPDPAPLRARDAAVPREERRAGRDADVARAGSIPDAGARTSRAQIVREVVEELRKKLESEVRTARPRGRRAATATSPLKLARNIDWQRTIRANLQGLGRRAPAAVPERFYFWPNQRRRHEWDVVILVDQSGSMAESVVYSSMMAAIFASLDVLRTAPRVLRHRDRRRDAAARRSGRRAVRVAARRRHRHQPRGRLRAGALHRAAREDDLPAHHRSLRGRRRGGAGRADARSSWSAG